MKDHRFWAGITTCLLVIRDGEIVKSQGYGHRIIEHAGAWQGFTTNISRYVDDKLTVVVLTNLEHADPVDISHRSPDSTSRLSRRPPRLAPRTDHPTEAMPGLRLKPVQNCCSYGAPKGVP